jgi:hypothetical protein
MSRFERRALREKEYFVAKQQAQIARDAAKVTKLRQDEIGRVRQPHLAPFSRA